MGPIRSAPRTREQRRQDFKTGVRRVECYRPAPRPGAIPFGYAVIDRAILYQFLRGDIDARSWFSLGSAWREAHGLGNCAIVRTDRKVVAERPSNWDWQTPAGIPLKRYSHFHHNRVPFAIVFETDAEFTRYAR